MGLVRQIRVIRHGACRAYLGASGDCNTGEAWCDGLGIQLGCTVSFGRKELPYEASLNTVSCHSYVCCAHASTSVTTYQQQVWISN